MNVNPYNCSISINGSGIQGVNQFSIENDNALEDVRFLGFDYFDKIQSSFVLPELTFSRKDYDNYVDPMRALTGDVGCSGEIIYRGPTGFEKLSFTGAYLTQYAAAFALDATPTYSYRLGIYGRVQKAGASMPAAPVDDILAPERNNITLISTRFSGFVVNDINYTMNITREPVFSMRSRQFAAVKRIKPIEVTMSVRYYAKSLSESMFASMQQGYGNPKDVISLKVTNEDGVFKDRLSGIWNVEGDSVSVSTEDEVMIQSSYTTFLPRTLY